MKKIIIAALVSAMLINGAIAFAENDNLLMNSGFDNELYGEGNWKFPNSGGWYTEGNAEITKDDLNRNLALIDSGLLYQRVALEKGVTYKLTLKLKAEKECDINIDFNDGAEEWPGIHSVSTETVSLNDEWQEFTVEFEAPNAQDYVVTFGTWDEIKIYADDITLTKSESYISKFKTGVDGDGVISYQADYTQKSAFMAALYDSSGKLIGCKTQDTTGSFDAVDNYGTYTVKAYLLKHNSPTRIKTQDVVYDEKSKNNEEHSIGPVKTLKLSKKEALLSVGGENEFLDAIITPEYAYNKNIAWTSSDENVATVSSNGIVTPIGEGTAVITAKTSNGTLSDECSVTVAATEAVSEIKLDKTKITLPEIGAVCSLNTNVNSKLIWTSDNTNVAEVIDGTVTAVNVGQATITAKTEDGKYSAECAVTVEKSDNTITNDTFYTDTDGNIIASQGGGIYKFGDKYYWYGVKYKEAEIYAASPENGIAGNAQFESFTCYSSTDLVNWTFEGYPMTRATKGMEEAGWVGRMGVAYNAKTKKYVLISQYAPGMMFATSDKPEGPYKFEKVVSGVDYFANGTTGDQTVFQDDDGKAYVICSSTSGREYLYVAPLRESDFLDIDADNVKEIYHDAEGKYIDENGEIAVKDKKGVEGNCMFKYNGNYYFTGSDLYGWNSSRVYVLQSEDILGNYNEETGLPYIMSGVGDNYAHNSQAGFYVTVHGSEQDLVIYCGDRWSDFAGNGIGYNQWVPITVDENNIPHFNDLHQWKLDAEKGTWEVGEGNNYIKNPEFEADRKAVLVPTGWTVYDNVDGLANGNLSGRQYAGNFVWQQTAKEDYTACLKQNIDNLPNGTYTLKAWVKSSGGQNICKLYADSGNEELNYALKAPIDEWTEVVISNINVNDGKCEVGLYSDAHANEWVQIDNISLVKNVD
jgi:uncharacterized protein YjdB